MKLRNKRRLTQIALFVISNLGFARILKTGIVCPFLYCYGCPFATFACPIGTLQNFLIYGQFPFLAVGSLGVYGIIFGRAFCGWACPFGTLHDMLTPTNRRKEVKTRNYWYVKYAILFLTLALAWFTLDTVFCKYCPAGSLFAALPYRLLNPSLSGPSSVYFYLHMFTLVLTIFFALLIGRFWCRYLCPMGAVAGTFNKVSLTTIDWDEAKCKKCKTCLDVCVMRITEMEQVGTSTDCILCGRCVEACPEKCLSFKVKR